MRGLNQLLDYMLDLLMQWLRRKLHAFLADL